MILRGIDRAAVFFADTDRYLFLATLAERALAASVGVNAHVPMTNHIHLLVSPGTDAGVSRLMKGLGQSPGGLCSLIAGLRSSARPTRLGVLGEELAKR